MIVSLPWLRAALTASVMLALGVTMHTLAGGSTSTSITLLAVFVVALLVARGAQGRPGSAPRTAGVLVLGQVAVHVALSPGTGAGSHAPHAMSSSHSAMSTADMAMTHGDALRTSTDAYGPQIASAIADALACLVSEPTMVAGHLLAAAALGWWLASGEQRSLQALTVLSGLSGTSARSLLDLLTAVWPLAERAARGLRTITSEAAPALQSRFVDVGHPHRGPPAFA